LISKPVAAPREKSPTLRSANTRSANRARDGKATHNFREFFALQREANASRLSALSAKQFDETSPIRTTLIT
jgi:hypothetical protein